MPAARDSTRPLGVVYTPPEVARAMVERVLRPLVEGKTVDELRTLRVCDPAVGEGVFLGEVIRFFTDLGLDPLLAQRCVVGVDIDPVAIARARAALGEGAQLVVGDALSIEWSAAFDVVIANPPYVRQESVAAKATLSGFATYHGVADLYVYFIELAHRILRPGGQYCIIVPNKWQTAAYGRSLRTFLVEQHSVDELIDLSAHDLFHDADAFPCIVIGTRDGDAARPLRAVRADSALTVTEALAATTLLDRALWTAEPWHIETGAEHALLSRLERSYPTLGELIGTRWSRGVVTGLNKAFVLDRATRDQLLDEEPAAATIIRPFLKGRDLRPYHAPPAERWILLVDRNTSLAELPRVRAHLEQFRAQLEPRVPGSVGPGRKPGPYAWWQLQDPVVPLAKSAAPRILYQDIQTSPLACLEESGAVPDTTVWILPSEDRVLLAILNSPLYGWIARHRFPPALNGAVRPKLAYMQRLPVPTATSELRAALTRHVAQRLPIADLVAELYELSAAERALI